MKKKRLKVYCYDRNVISNEINSYKDINLTSNLKRNYYDGILILVPHKHIKDLGEKKIRVNGISLGPMRTLSGAAIKDARYIYSWSEKNSPLGKSVSFEDLSGSSSYLLSNQSSGVTGEIHYVDAGYNVIGMIKPPEKA